MKKIKWLIVLLLTIFITVTFALADGAMFDNAGRGMFLRRI